MSRVTVMIARDELMHVYNVLMSTHKTQAASLVFDWMNAAESVDPIRGGIEDAIGAGLLDPKDAADYDEWRRRQTAGEPDYCVECHGFEGEHDPGCLAIA